MSHLELCLLWDMSFVLLAVCVLLRLTGTNLAHLLQVLAVHGCVHVGLSQTPQTEGW